MGKRILLWLPLIVAVAAGLRLGYLWEYQAHAPHRALGAIPFLFEPGNIADSLAAGHGFASPFRASTGPTAWMTPVYPLLLAGVFRLLGAYTFAAFLAAAGLNILFSTLACVPIYFGGKRIAGPAAGAAGAWLWAMFPNAILLPVEAMWDTSLAALLGAALLWATLGVAESRRARAWCGYGLLWGLALMTTPTLGVLLPFLLGWLMVRQGWARPAVALGLAALCCVPWTVRNYRIFHTVVPLRSVLGLQVWIGNNERSERVPAGRLHPIDNQEERDRYSELGEIEYMREKRQQALAFAVAHPGTELRYSAHRFLATWAGGTPSPVHDFLRVDSLRFRFILAFNVLAALAGAAGILILYRRRNPYWFPAACFPVIFPCIGYLTLASARYRHPIDPALLLLAGCALTARRPKAAAAQPPKVRPKHGPSRSRR